MDLRSNTVVSVMEIAKLLGPGSAEAAALGGDGHKHPHDAIFLPNGDVVVGTWNPGHLSYWRCAAPPLPRLAPGPLSCCCSCCGRCC